MSKRDYKFAGSLAIIVGLVIWIRCHAHDPPPHHPRPFPDRRQINMKTLTVPLVGMHFRPPAKQVLAALPSGAELILEPEPENPYDPKAVKVLARTKAIPTSQHSSLDESLQGTGVYLQDLLAWEDIWLGYVADSDGKVCAGGKPGNREVVSAMLSASHQATLVFLPDGKPAVVVSWEEP